MDNEEGKRDKRPGRGKLFVRGLCGGVQHNAWRQWVEHSVCPRGISCSAMCARVRLSDRLVEEQK